MRVFPAPLPGGERSDREAIRVRGTGPLDRFVPPHPNPLPCGEREPAHAVASRSPQSLRGRARLVHSASLGLLLMSAALAILPARAQAPDRGEIHGLKLGLSASSMTL